MLNKFIFGIAVLTTSLFGNFYDLKQISITNDIHCVIGDFNPPTKQNKGFVSNMCYVDIGDSLVVLDAGPTYSFAKEFYSIMKKRYPSKDISHVVLSNFHDDRILGSSFFKKIGAKIVGHITLNEDIKNYKSKFGRIKKITSKKVYENTKLINADTLVEGGYKIVGSKKTLEIIKPSEVSEEKSDIAIYSKDDSFLFVGNMIFNGRMLNYRKASSVDGWIESLENLVKLDAKYILGGHGSEYDKNSYKPSLEYLKILKRDVTKAYENDIDRADVKKYVEIGLYKDIPYYSQLNNNNINNYYDQLEWE